MVWNGATYEEPQLTKEQAQDLMKASNALMLRNIFDWDCSQQTNFWEIICDQSHDISELPSKTRNQIRRCNRECDIRIISPKELVDADGYYVFRKSYERYHDVTTKIPLREYWEKEIIKSNGFEYWGVFRKEDGQLIAWSMNSAKGFGVNYHMLKAIPEFMNKHYPYYGLLFEMNNYYLDCKKFKYVTDGFRSISGHSNIQPFLEKNFKFRKAYCRIKIFYRYWFKCGLYMVYPFRKIIPSLAIKNLLRLEEIQRNDFKE